MLNSDTMKYKTRIANILCSSEDILEALDVSVEEDILYNYIYPYIYIPGVEEKVRSVICYALNFPKILSNNEYFKDSNLIFYIISHRSAMKTTYNGTRVDLLEGLILKILNWNVDIGLELRLKSSEEKIITDHYYARVVVFQTLKFNSLDMGVKQGLFK